jgi:hypothetical protein
MVFSNEAAVKYGLLPQIMEGMVFDLLPWLRFFFGLPVRPGWYCSYFLAREGFFYPSDEVALFIQWSQCFLTFGHCMLWL